jgi:hypothetical protein
MSADDKSGGSSLDSSRRRDPPSDGELVFCLATERVKGPPVLPHRSIIRAHGGDRRENRLRDRQREPEISILDIPTARAKRNASS